MLYYKPACHYEITSNQVITGCMCIVTIKLALLLLGFSAGVLYAIAIQEKILEE